MCPREPDTGLSWWTREGLTTARNTFHGIEHPFTKAVESHVRSARMCRQKDRPQRPRPDTHPHHHKKGRKGDEESKELAQGDLKPQRQPPLDPKGRDSHDPVVSCTATCPWQQWVGRTRFCKSHRRSARAMHRSRRVKEKTQGWG